MSHEHEAPPRLLSDPSASAPLREALERMAALEIPADARARLAQKVIAGPAGPSAPSSSLGAKVGAGLAALAIGAVVFVATRPAPTPAAPPAELQATVASPPRAAEPENVAITPSAPPALSPTVSSAASPPGNETSPKPSAPANAPLADEATLFRGAGSALRAGDDAKTLTLVDELARRFPNGTFAQEREILRIDALLQVGRTDEARAGARAFLAEHPESAHRARLETILAPR